MAIPFGRLMLLFMITGGMFNAASKAEVIISTKIFETLYTLIGSLSGVLAMICLVIWLLIKIWNPVTLLLPGGSLSSVGWLRDLLCGIPHFRIGLSALIISVAISGIFPFISAVALTIFLVATSMWIARILLMVYGSANW